MMPNILTRFNTDYSEVHTGHKINISLRANALGKYLHLKTCILKTGQDATHRSQERAYVPQYKQSCGDKLAYCYARLISHPQEGLVSEIQKKCSSFNPPSCLQHKQEIPPGHSDPSFAAYLQLPTCPKPPLLAYIHPYLFHPLC